jgi:hypothetical protein
MIVYSNHIIQKNYLVLLKNCTVFDWTKFVYTVNTELLQISLFFELFYIYELYCMITDNLTMLK